MEISADMELIDQQKLARTLYKVVDLLVRHEYTTLKEFCHCEPNIIEWVKREIDEWPDTFVMPPSDRLEDIVDTVIERKGTVPQEWFVDVNLWTEGEGISDLTLQLILTDSDDEYYDVQIQDMDVL